MEKEEKQELPESVVELTDIIEDLFEREPDKRKKKEHAQWVIEINKVIVKCNSKAGLKLYKTL